MKDSSDDEIEILSASQKPARPPTQSPVDAFIHVSNLASGASLASNRNGLRQNGHSNRNKANVRVLQLSDGSDEDDLPAPFRANSHQPAPRDVRSVSATSTSKFVPPYSCIPSPVTELIRFRRYKPDAIDLSTSEDLAAPGNLWSGGTVAGPSRLRSVGGVPIARSISLAGTSSTGEPVSPPPQKSRCGLVR